MQMRYLLVALSLFALSEAVNAAGKPVTGNKPGSKQKLKGGYQAPPCARTCHEEACTDFTLRYGKFCGVGHGGCPGEAPCDGLDACCKTHDDCVEQSGMRANKCHSAFAQCMHKENKRNHSGFSHKCPYSMVIPVMQSGMQFAMMFGQQAQEL